MTEEWIENARMMVDSARAVVPGDGSVERVRKTRFQGAGFDREVMRQVAELGFFLIRVEEDEGGFGLGMRETCELMRVLGGGLLPEPVLSSMMSGALLQSALPETVRTGEEVIVMAWQDQTGSLSWAGGARGGTIDGHKVNVPGAEGADLFAVITSNGVALVPRDAAGLAVTGAETLDGGRIGSLSFASVDVEFLPCERIKAVLEDATLGHSAYLMGLAERALDITLDYLRMRKQFGQPIGSFQSLQHRATEMKIQLELSRAAIFATARRFDTGADPMTRAQSVARCKLRAAQMTMLVMREAVQMHGAMGITDEADIGLYVRKAMTEVNFFGPPRVHRQILANLLEDAS